MAAMPFLPTPAALRQRRADRLTTTHAVRNALVSLAGLVGTAVRNPAGQDVGILLDIVARLSGAAYPPVTGLVVRVGRRRTFVPATAIGRIERRGIVLKTARVDMLEFDRRPGEVLLAKDVLDHQLVDTDGVQVIRAGDLYLAPVGPEVRLMGVDVSLQSLLRRLGPRRLRAIATLDHIIDWAAIAPFGNHGTTAPATVRLRAAHTDLHRLRPGELADLLEDLGREERQRLLQTLEPHRAADALEEMDPEELEVLLREATPARAAELLTVMEPDEAVDALRDLSADERSDVLDAMPEDASAELSRLLDYDERTAGGIMTSRLVTLRAQSTVAEARTALTAQAEHHSEIDAVVVCGDQGELLVDVPLFDLLIAAPEMSLGAVLAALDHAHDPVTVSTDTRVSDIAARLVDSRASSLLVLDEDKHPVGRILADDILDALLPERGRLHFPRLLR